MISLKNSSALFVTLFLVVALPACWPFSTSSKADFALNDSFVLISVNDKNVHDDCSIKGSINVALSDLAAFSEKLKKETEIVVYCTNYMCSASGVAAKQLKALGFERVRAYEGGNAQWFQASFPVEGKCEMPYLKQVMQKPAGENSADVVELEELKKKMDEFYYSQK